MFFSPVTQTIDNLKGKVEALEKENEDLKKQIRVLTLCLEKLFNQ